MARAIRLVAAGAVGLALLLATSTAAPAAHRVGSATFLDATGENPAAPDITSVDVSNDDLRVLTFTIHLANRPSLDTSEVLLALNTDKDFATGDDTWDGAEYALDLTVRDGGGLAKWNGSQWDWGTPQSTLLSSYADGVATFKIGAADLGNTKAFTFVAAAAEGEEYDWAPDVGDFSYSLKVAAPVKKTVAQLRAKHAKAKKKKRKHRS